MVSLLIAFVILLTGSFFYSKLAARVFKADDRITPAVEHPDGVDFTPMKPWRLFLVQLLNIAGLGPIFGALAGACWGPRVYLWIVFGTILGGGVHDYITGMLSERNNGASISEIIGKYLGKVILQVVRVFSVILLILIGVNFIKNPAQLISIMTPGFMNAEFWVIIILVYYFVATFLPVDKIIGKVYPFFGLCLIVMAFGLFGVMLFNPVYRERLPELWEFIGKEGMGHPDGTPVWAQMFVSVACGAVSGFHATQSPIVARCITSEKQGRAVFYGAMTMEGVIALIWAAAGVCFYGSVGSLSEALKGGTSIVVNDICTGMMGTVGGILALIGVIACPITSGDTAFRSARLTIADWFKIDQKPILKRLLTTLPLLVVGGLLAHWGDFGILWKYASWANQALTAFVFWAGAVYLWRYGISKAACLMAALPGAFMTAVATTYFFQAQECLGLSTAIAYPVGIGAALICSGVYINYLISYEKKKKKGLISEEG